MDTNNVEFGHLYHRESKEDYMVRISQLDQVESSEVTDEEDKKLIIEAE